MPTEAFHPSEEKAVLIRTIGIHQILVTELIRMEITQAYQVAPFLLHPLEILIMEASQVLTILMQEEHSVVDTDNFKFSFI